MAKRRNDLVGIIWAAHSELDCPLNFNHKIVVQIVETLTPQLWGRCPLNVYDKGQIPC